MIISARRATSDDILIIFIILVLLIVRVGDKRLVDRGPKPDQPLPDISRLRHQPLVDEPAEGGD